MGDVITHAQITAHVVEQLKRTFGPKAIPEDDYTYVELGNFLTDVKQFRDPPSFHRAREFARDAAQAEAGVASGPVGVDDWAVRMFGRKDPPGPRHGAVPEFLRLLAYAFTHEVFDADGLAQLAKSQLPAGADPALIPNKALPAAEVDRVMENGFDQYWPHDHLDFPAVRDEDLPRHREDRLFQRQRLGYIGFLQRYIAYVAQELTKLEAEWATAAAAQLTDQQQRDFLVRLGTLLHAVEDFYFHSNMAELRQWQLISRLFRGRTPEEIFRRGLAGIGPPDETEVRLRRIFYRRLRYPVFESGGTLSLERSEDATDLLYTGGFYQTDVFHTLGGALEAAERLALMLGAGSNPANSKLVLVRLAFSEDTRRDLVRGGDSAAKALRDEHAAQLANGDYTRAIAERRQAGTIAAAAADRLDEAFALDKAREDEFKFLPGPGAILINLLSGIQRERDESARAAMSFDATEQSITIERTNNDASAENIGTHSLMSKDSDSKKPFRGDAVVLAKHASAGVATVLAARIKDRRRPLDQGIDWLVVLPFFLRFPRAGSLRWEEELLTGLRKSKDGFKQPDVDAVREQPPVPFLGPARDPKLLADQRAGKLRQELRAAYRSFEK